jgi:hypothetical protein
MGATLVSCLGQSFRNERRNRAILDTLLAYKTQFPYLEEHANFLSMTAMAYAGYFGDCFEASDATNGEKNRELFEQLVGKEQITIILPDLVGRGYSEAATYYFKKGQKAKAKALINKGLEIVPNNYQLRTRKQMLN